MLPELPHKKVMGSIANNNKKKLSLHFWRRITQISFIFLLNPYFFRLRNICFPVLNCWGCPIAAFACPIGALGQFLAHGVFPFLVLGSLIFFGVIIGRMLCGWVCPFGFIQDLLYKIPSPKINLPSFLKYGKYLTLLIMVILIPLFYGIYITPGKITPKNFFFCNLCPAGTLEANIPNILTTSNDDTTPDDALTQEAFYQPSQQNIVQSFMKSTRFWILIVFLIAFVFITRPFCRALCPIGAIFAIFNKVSIFKLVVDKIDCTEGINWFKCTACLEVCPTSRKIYTSPNSPECIRCLECQKKCPVEAVENQYF